MKYNIHPTCQISLDILDKIYSEHFAFSGSGVFVEVGAYDGVTYSNTSCLSEIGWKGLYIEADPKSAFLCLENHKNNKDVIVCSSAVSNHTGICKLYKSKINGDSVSSILLEKTNIDWGCRDDNFEIVPVDTLDNILKKHNMDFHHDLLVIDVEEAELSVLEGYSLERYLPKLAIVEINERSDNFSLNKRASILSYFSAKYDIIYSDHINTIFSLKK